MKPNIYDYDKSAFSIVENNSLYNRHLLKLRNIYEPPKGVPGLQQQFNQFSKLQLQMIDDRKRLKEQQFIQKKIRNLV